MVFAICKTEELDGLFTFGRLYFGLPLIDEVGLVDLKSLRFRDDNGGLACFDPACGFFNFPDFVYAVVVSAWGNFLLGEVVVVNDIGDDGKFFRVVNSGYVCSSNLKMLDTTVVYPGMVVYDRLTNHWGRLSLVADSGFVLSGSNRVRVPLDFIFAVRAGELSELPLVRCVRAGAGLTYDSIYVMDGLDDFGGVVLLDDNGQERSFSHENFVFI